jgi:hypothetical protein
MRWIVIVIAVAGRTAAAQAPGEVAGGTPLQVAFPAPEMPRPMEEPKSMLTAFLLSAGATTLPMAIAAVAEDGASGTRDVTAAIVGTAAFVLGPSAGHWYAGEGVTNGLVLRAAGMGLAFGLALYDPHMDHPALTVGGLITAMALLQTGLIWDFVTVPQAVRRANRRALGLAPLATWHGPAMGLSLAGTL